MTHDEAVSGLRDFLRAVWKDNDEETALLLWRERARLAPNIAEHDLDCLRAVIADPPADLIEIMQEDGWIMLEHEPDPATVETQSLEEHVLWLRDVLERFARAL